MNYTNDVCWIKVNSFLPCINHLLSFSQMQIINFLTMLNVDFMTYNETKRQVRLTQG